MMFKSSFKKNNMSNISFDFELSCGSSELNNSVRESSNNLHDIVQAESKKHAQYKIIYETLKDCVKQKLLSEPLNSKLKSILMFDSCAQCLNIDYSEEGELKLLGLDKAVDSTDLSYSESILVKSILERQLSETYHQVCDRTEAITGASVENLLLEDTESKCSVTTLSMEDKITIDSKKELDAEQDTYVKLLLEKLRLLEEIAKLRLEQVPEKTERKLQEFQLKFKMNNVRSELTEVKTTIDIIMETDKSLEAYKILIQDIKKQQEECQHEIEELEELREKYKLVACKQFDDILKTYLQYKSSLERKKIIYETLKK